VLGRPFRWQSHLRFARFFLVKLTRRRLETKPGGGRFAYLRADVQRGAMSRSLSSGGLRVLPRAALKPVSL